MSEQELWKPIPGFPGYEVSDRGRVRNSRGLVLKLGTNSGGYRTVVLYDETGGKFTRTVHTLVLSAFVGPRPPKLETRHLDGNSANNFLSNLKYGTRSENAHDRIRHGTHNYASRDRCKHDHPFTEWNTQVRTGKKTGRRCRSCNAATVTVWTAAQHGETLDFAQVAAGKYEQFRVEHEAFLTAEASA